jgi:hypothetical protein
MEEKKKYVLYVCMYVCMYVGTICCYVQVCLYIVFNFFFSPFLSE